MPILCLNAGRFPKPGRLTSRALNEDRMSRDRLTCFITGSTDAAASNYFPENDDHAVWDEIDALADAIHSCLKPPGAAFDDIDGLLTTSSDTPWGCSYFWVRLPDAPTLRAEVLAICLDHLSRARLALPNVSWELSLDDAPLAWDGARFLVEG
jgi:hypothetical protein